MDTNYNKRYWHDRRLDLNGLCMFKPNVWSLVYIGPTLEFIVHYKELFICKLQTKWLDKYSESFPSQNKEVENMMGNFYSFSLV